MLSVISISAAVTLMTFAVYVFVLRRQIDANEEHIRLLRADIEHIDGQVEVRDATIYRLLEEKKNILTELKVVRTTRRRGKLLRWVQSTECKRAVVAHIGRFDVWKSLDGNYTWAFFVPQRKDPIHLGFAADEAMARQHSEMYAHSLAGDIDDSFCHENKA